MGSLLSLVAGWKGYAALALACFLAGSLGTWRVMSWREGAQETKRLVKTVQLVEKRGKITFDIAMNFETPRLKIQQDTQQRLSEVDLHVTPKVDSEFPVPCGFVRVFNAATHGRPLPDPTGCPDGAASDIAFSAVGKTETINDGQYDLISEQLKALQEWVRQQQNVHQ
jgi:hypothetical protein